MICDLKCCTIQTNINMKYITMISNEMSKRWKDQTERQEIYSGSATRTPSLPYSTPRAPNSRVFFTISTSSLMAEKTLHTNLHTNIHTNLHTNIHTNLHTNIHTNLHTNYHTTTSSHLSHNFYNLLQVDLLHN
jgi:hypothetical protein